MPNELFDLTVQYQAREDPERACSQHKSCSESKNQRRFSHYELELLAVQRYEGLQNQIED